MSAQPFPWHLVERATHEGARTLAAVRRWLVQRGASAKATARLSEIAGGETSLRLRRAKIGPAEGRAGFVAVALTFAGRPEERFVVVAEQALAATLALRSMKRKAPRAFDPKRAPPEALAGSFGAIAVAALRAGGGDTTRVEWCGDAADLSHAKLPATLAVVDALLFVGDDAFEVALYAPVDAIRRAPPLPFDAERLAALGSCPIAVPVVLAAVALSRADFASLGPGDVVAGSRRDDVVLVSPHCERGLRAKLGADGSLVIGTDGEEVPMSIPEDAVRNAADAPVVVRIEAGSVTMSAREWAGLQPGDVVATGHKISEPVILRVGGVEVARGELVELEGEIGVRIVSRS